MKRLSPTMVDALLAFRASDEDMGPVPVGVRVDTTIALEERGLIESRLHPDPTRARWDVFVYRRTLQGENVAIEESLAREASAA